MSHHGKRKREEEGNRADRMIYRPTHYEFDENNVVVDLRCPYTTPQLSESMYRDAGNPKRSRRSPSSAPQHPIQWRDHDEVAIEIGKYKQTLALHDLVDEDNFHIMLLHKDRAIIQGEFEQVVDLGGKTIQSWGKERTASFFMLSLIHGEDGIEHRTERRDGGLVNIHYQCLSMNWDKAKEMMSRAFPKPDGSMLALLDIRPAVTPRPEPGYLKPGHRLVRIEEVLF
ncbi:uncharacterized protein F4822DRAFT_442846 [Hypoxylon trugodes]|uniref:uncharacterized protein n=1 Tax=Hypoxylon trugodes TaxID=326681 RepID=UPI0021950C63|nr:uncharacterized protein F4822DRAFT_442846 [Hypoxylon trugodes]KAI1389607.1 hypothetical protein F4822DRAFT_442846 [Hypoxylon trugodes]